jgi:hypothetical protein
MVVVTVLMIVVTIIFFHPTSVVAETAVAIASPTEVEVQCIRRRGGGGSRGITRTHAANIYEDDDSDIDHHSDAEDDQIADGRPNHVLLAEKSARRQANGASPRECY